MLYGAIPFGITFFLQWLVPPFNSNVNTNQWGLFWYYVLVAILFNTFYTVVNLPYTALTPELTQDYDERTTLNSFRFAFSIGSSILSVIFFGIIAALFPNNRQLQYFNCCLRLYSAFGADLVLVYLGHQKSRLGSRSEDAHS
jgi:GPH family glycoside/pentoside/hexuronide:cation symporter